MSLHRFAKLIAYLALAGLLAGCEDLPAAKKPESKTPSPSKPASATHKVAKGALKIEVACKGVFEAAEMSEVALNPEAWTPQGGGQLTIVKAVEHGARVRKGDTLVSLDLEKLEQTIRDVEAEQGLTELAIKLAERELPVLERSTPVDLAVAVRNKQMADEDLRRFLDLDRAMMEKSAHFYVKMASNSLEYMKEELKQLEKMYRAKDLTEETEEIILRRTRNWVEMYTFFLRMAEHERDQALKIELPRREQKLKDAVTHTDLALEKAQTTLPLNLQQKQLTLKKLCFERDKTAERLAKLRKDRDSLTVQAPCDGIVFHGRCERGHWNISSASSKLHPGSHIQPHDVLLTVVKNRPLFVRATVDEKHLASVRTGTKGKVIPNAEPDTAIAARVEKVLEVPIAEGKFEARIALETGKETELLVPGMECTVKFVPYARADIVVIPAKALFTDELDEEKHFVYVCGPAGVHEKRRVVPGKKGSDKVEIKEGLKEGDEILLEEPGHSTSAAKKEGT